MSAAQLKILVVQDEALIHKLFRMGLKTRDFRSHVD
jgi:hypothetical protein